MNRQLVAPPMPEDPSIAIDPEYGKTLQGKVKDFLQSKVQGFAGSRPVDFGKQHISLLANEEYFVAEKVAGVRYMLLSTHTPKGPACFLIDRHDNITFLPNLLLPMRDNPSKHQNDTLLDGELILDTDGDRRSLRYLIFDLMVLNGTVVTQRSYSTRLGMMEQDILNVQAAKSQETRAAEPFKIERKPMQRSYGLNVVLGAEHRHPHGHDALIFAPVREPYSSGICQKLLKWKSHITAQFQIKVTQSKERKPLYCIHVKSGTSFKFYDYVTPEPALATEWYSSSPDGVIAEFWWDANWPTQMFEKGLGLEVRIGGWRFYRVRKDKKEADDEPTLTQLVKGQSNIVTREDLESQIEHIRSQWKAREANGGSVPAPKPPPKPKTSVTLPEAGMMTPAVGTNFLLSPSMGHSGSQGYFGAKRDRGRERRPSIGDIPPPAITAPRQPISHPLPPKPQPYQPRIPTTSSSSTSTNTWATAASAAEATTDATTEATTETTTEVTVDATTAAESATTELLEKAVDASLLNKGTVETPKRIADHESKSSPSPSPIPSSTTAVLNPAPTTIPSTAAATTPSLAASLVPAAAITSASMSTAVFVPMSSVSTSTAVETAPIPTTPTSVSSPPIATKGNNKPAIWKLPQVQAHLQPIKPWMVEPLLGRKSAVTTPTLPEKKQAVTITEKKHALSTDRKQHSVSAALSGQTGLTIDSKTRNSQSPEKPDTQPHPVAPLVVKTAVTVEDSDSKQAFGNKSQASISIPMLEEKSGQMTKNTATDGDLLDDRSPPVLGKRALESASENSSATWMQQKRKLLNDATQGTESPRTDAVCVELGTMHLANGMTSSIAADSPKTALQHLTPSTDSQSFSEIPVTRETASVVQSDGATNLQQYELSISKRKAEDSLDYEMSVVSVEKRYTVKQGGTVESIDQDDTRSKRDDIDEQTFRIRLKSEHEDESAVDSTTSPLRIAAMLLDNDSGAITPQKHEPQNVVTNSTTFSAQRAAIASDVYPSPTPQEIYESDDKIERQKRMTMARAAAEAAIKLETECTKRRLEEEQRARDMDNLKEASKARLARAKLQNQKDESVKTRLAGWQSEQAPGERVSQLQLLPRASAKRAQDDIQSLAGTRSSSANSLADVPSSSSSQPATWVQDGKSAGTASGSRKAQHRRISSLDPTLPRPQNVSDESVKAGVGTEIEQPTSRSSKENLEAAPPMSVAQKRTGYDPLLTPVHRRSNSDFGGGASRPKATPSGGSTVTKYLQQSQTTEAESQSPQRTHASHTLYTSAAPYDQDQHWALSSDSTQVSSNAMLRQPPLPGPNMSNSGAASSSTASRDQPSVKRGAKTMLQFILNDEPSQPSIDDADALEIFDATELSEQPAHYSREPPQAQNAERWVGQAGRAPYSSNPGQLSSDEPQEYQRTRTTSHRSLEHSHIHSPLPSYPPPQSQSQLNQHQYQNPQQHQHQIQHHPSPLPHHPSAGGRPLSSDSPLGMHRTNSGSKHANGQHNSGGSVSHSSKTVDTTVYSSHGQLRQSQSTPVLAHSRQNSTIMATVNSHSGQAAFSSADPRHLPLSRSTIPGPGGDRVDEPQSSWTMDYQDPRLSETASPRAPVGASQSSQDLTMLNRPGNVSAPPGRTYPPSGAAPARQQVSSRQTHHYAQPKQQLQQQQQPPPQHSLYQQQAALPPSQQSHPHHQPNLHDQQAQHVQHSRHQQRPPQAHSTQSHGQQPHMLQHAQSHEFPMVQLDQQHYYRQGYPQHSRQQHPQPHPSMHHPEQYTHSSHLNHHVPHHQIQQHPQHQQPQQMQGHGPPFSRPYHSMMTDADQRDIQHTSTPGYYQDSQQ